VSTNLAEQVEHIRETPPHSCEVCQSKEYVRAEIILKRSGLNPANWGYLLHDIARAIRGELKEIDWQLANYPTPAPLSSLEWLEQNHPGRAIDLDQQSFVEEVWNAAQLAIKGA
jgi:hypothetical protein